MTEIPSKPFLTLSFSSLFITLIVSTVLIIAFQFLLKYKKTFHLFPINLIRTILILIFIKLIFPVELYFSININSEYFMVFIRTILDTPVVFHFSVKHVLITFWILGTIMNSIPLWHGIHDCNQLYRDFQKNGIRKKVSDYLEGYPKDYAVLLVKDLKNPTVLPFHSMIAIPQGIFTEEETARIVAHEIKHLEGNDTMILLIANILKVVYWWFIPLKYLNKTVRYYLELRADAKATQSMSETEKYQYALTLTDYQQKLQDEPAKKNTFQLSILEDNHILLYRLKYLLDPKLQFQYTKKFYLVFIILFTLFTNLLIIEPSYPNSELLKGAYSEEEILNEDNYIIHKKDGSYYIVFENGKETAYIGDKLVEPFTKLRVIEEE